jgi:hypothetical protein
MIRGLAVTLTSAIGSGGVRAEGITAIEWYCGLIQAIHRKVAIMPDNQSPAVLMTCKQAEILTQDGRCLMPAANIETGCKTGEVVFDGRCLFPLPPQNMNCKAVQLVIEPACLQAEGCLPDPAVGVSLMFALLVKCL